MGETKHLNPNDPPLGLRAAKNGWGVEIVWFSSSWKY